MANVHQIVEALNSLFLRFLLPLRLFWSSHLISTLIWRNQNFYKKCQYDVKRLYRRLQIRLKDQTEEDRYSPCTHYLIFTPDISWKLQNVVLQHCSLDNRQLLRNGKGREFEFECTGGRTLSGKLHWGLSMYNYDSVGDPGWSRSAWKCTVQRTTALILPPSIKNQYW